MRRIALISVGLLVAGCGAVGQTAGRAAAQRTSPFSGAAAQREESAPTARALPAVQDVPHRVGAATGVMQDSAALLAGEGWLSTARNDYNLSMDADARLMVFARSDAEFEGSRIWLAHREGQGWRAPMEAPFTDPRYRDSDPWLTPDGATLYFASNRPVAGEAPNGSLDIWRVAVDAGRFGAPEHLAAVASEGEELGPELHDGWLYFNSSRKGGPAKLSIFRARVSGQGFDMPEAMPAPFNDGDLQGDFTLSPDGRVAVFWSRREGSDELDLFAACRRPTAWSRAVRLPASINGTGMDFTPAFSSDGRALYFASMRTGDRAAAPGSVLNGQSNVYAAPATLVDAALRAGACGA